MVTNTERPRPAGVTKPYRDILYEKKPPIAYVTYNRPEKLNALSDNLRREFRDAMGDAGWDDKDIKVIVIKGAGRGFSAGWDLADSARPELKDASEYFRWAKYVHQCLWDGIWDNPKPVIAQVHGFCLAAGMAMASTADLCICSEDALFGYPMVRTGGPFLAAVWPYILGIRKAKELMYTGSLIDAQEAYRLNLVNKVVPSNKLEEEVNKMARTISKLDNLVNECSKRCINMVYELMNLRKANDWADEMEVLPSSCPESAPMNAEYSRIRDEQGLKAALDWRQSRFAEEDAWWMERLKARQIK